MFLKKIGNGDKKKLEAQYPLEVQPLATEINELLEHNEKIVEIQQQASLTKTTIHEFIWIYFFGTGFTKYA